MKKKQRAVVIQVILMILGIFAINFVQFYHLQTSLQMNTDLAGKQLENLKSDMQEDGVSPEVRNHISKVAENATFQSNLLIGSLTRTQLFAQAMSLLLICTFCLSLSRSNQTE